LTPEQLAQTTYTVVDGCNFQAEWIINIRGTGAVTLSGDSFPAIPGGVLYNIIGARTVFVHDTQVNGHILAPAATLNQTGGVIVGKVVAADIVFALQINKQNTCPVPVPVSIPLVPSVPVNAGDSEFALQNSVSNFRINDNIVLPNDKVLGKIIAINSDKNTVTVDTAACCTASWPAHSVFKVVVSSTQSRAADPVNAQSSSASVSQIAFAVVVALFALAL